VAGQARLHGPVRLPAATGQRENELIGAQNLSALAAVYQIHADVLDLLSTASKPFTTYAQVRRRLGDYLVARRLAGRSSQQTR